MDIWNTLRHFKRTERWGDPDMMNGLLLLLLDEIRNRIDASIIIHCGFSTTGHVKKSQHYAGNAADFHIINSRPFYQQVRHIEEILAELQVDDCVGLGIYPDGNTPYFHLDVRGSQARWGYLYGAYCSYELARQWAERQAYKEEQA
ncbi:MAG: DUF882 domain-containing protein [Deltaproteobacteria bacterium]|nr:DUF882 domain-containing protein [Deltaproteobacteria bacterium]